MIKKYSKPYSFIWKIQLFAPFRTWLTALFGLEFEICVILMSVLSLVSITAATFKDKAELMMRNWLNFD